MSEPLGRKRISLHVNLHGRQENDIVVYLHEVNLIVNSVFEHVVIIMQIHPY